MHVLAGIVRLLSTETCQVLVLQTTQAVSLQSKMGPNTYTAQFSTLRLEL